jgi:ribosomal protein S18 acetylase RimI-like enzyme
VADVEIRAARAEDLEPTYDVITACQAPLFGAPELTLEHLRHSWDQWQGFTAWEGARVVGSSGVRDDDVVVLVRPEERRRGIGTRLLEAAEQVASPDVVQAVAVSLEPAAAPFLRANSYEKAFEVWLMGVHLGEPQPEPRWPDGIDVRTFRPEDAPALKQLLDDAYAEEPGRRPAPFEEWFRSMVGDPSFDAAVWFLAEASDGLAGAALNWSDGFVKDLVVHPRWRRRGLGEALLRRTFQAFRDRAIPRVTLKTDSNNPTQAWRLYERLGMRTERTYEVFEKRLRPGVPLQGMLPRL